MKTFFTKLHYEKTPNFFESLIIKGLSIFSVPYGIVTSVRNFLYDKNILKAYNSGVFTVSVGNLTTGGVGKTPFVKELVRFYLNKGFRPAVISRGYGGSLNSKKVNVISDGTKIFYEASEAGDEPFWLAKNCPGAYVLTCASRKKSAKFAKEAGCDVIIADDAFQHRALHRDIDLVLCDGLNGFGNEKLLPAGPLRESFSGISRADKIVVTNKSASNEYALKYCETLEKRCKKPIFLCQMTPERYTNLTTGEPVDPENKRAIAFCAIGQPENFYDFVRGDFLFTGKVSFPDHHEYTEEDVNYLIKAADNNYACLVTTEKDAVKISRLAKNTGNVEIYVMKLSAVADIEEILKK